MRRSPQSGFTLIKILAVMAILILLATLAMSVYNSVHEQRRVAAGTQSVADIAKRMKAYVDLRKNGAWPKESGIKFLLKLWNAGEGHDAKVFLCPGTQELRPQEGRNATRER